MPLPVNDQSNIRAERAKGLMHCCGTAHKPKDFNAHLKDKHGIIQPLCCVCGYMREDFESDEAFELHLNGFDHPEANIV